MFINRNFTYLPYDPLALGTVELGGGRVVLALSPKVGTVKYWFNGENGYGFIHPEDGGEAVFVHHTGVAPYSGVEGLREGTRVTYEVVREKMCGLWAKEVCRVD
jgi:cold shock protein